LQRFVQWGQAAATLPLIFIFGREPMGSGMGADFGSLQQSKCGEIIKFFLTNSSGMK